jgi:hypothetical protein
MPKILTTSPNSTLDYSWPNSHDPCGIEFSSRRNEKKRLWQEVMYNWADGLKTRLESYIQDTKMYNMRPPVATEPEPNVSENLRKRILRPSKCLRVTQRKHDTFDSRLSWPLKNYIFRWLKWSRVHVMNPVSPGVKDFPTQQESHFQAAKMMKSCSRKVCILQPRFSWPLNYLIFRPPKCRTEALWILDSFGYRVSWPLRIVFSGNVITKKAFTKPMYL